MLGRLRTVVRAVARAGGSCESRTRALAGGMNTRAYNIPIVVEQSESGERSFDIFSRLLRERVVCVNGPIDDNTAKLTYAQLLYLESEHPSRPIQMYINSPGGSVTAGMAIYDTMQYIRCDISTICVGQACSMGSLLLAAGTPGLRKILPNARVMIHQPSSGTQLKDFEAGSSLAPTVSVDVGHKAAQTRTGRPFPWIERYPYVHFIRYKILANARVMIHQPSSGTQYWQLTGAHQAVVLTREVVIRQGTVEDMHIYMRELVATRHRLNVLYAMHTGQTVEKLAEAMDRDYFLTPHEAVKFGLVDEVIDRRPPPEPLLPGS